MNFHSRINISLVVIGISMLFVGANIVYRGGIWNLILGNERYLVGGIALLAGVYITAMGFKKQ